ncbi:MAG: hypothetical protein GY820_32350 [Gammaproteobacteria bacterium]|nr:hypothetical protein [Gammaproteobacteria bacterium]
MSRSNVKHLKFSSELIAWKKVSFSVKEGRQLECQTAQFAALAERFPDRIQFHLPIPSNFQRDPFDRVGRTQNRTNVRRS